MKLLSLRLKTFTNASVTSNVTQCCATRRDKFEYRNLGLSWLSTAKSLRTCCIKFLKLLRMVSPTTKQEQGMHTLVAALLNNLSSIFRFPWVRFTLWIFLQVLTSSSEKEYFLLAIMPTNCSQLKELETVQLLDFKSI